MESRVTVRSIACAVLSSRARSRSVGPSPADAAEPKLDNGIGTQAALSNPNCDPETKRDQDPVDRAGAVCEGRAAADKNGGKHRARRHQGLGEGRHRRRGGPHEAAHDAGRDRDRGTKPGDRRDRCAGRQREVTRARCSQQFYETYGRSSTSSSTCGPGSTSRRSAPTRSPIAEKKPFAVLSALKTTGDVLAQQKIITFDVPSDPEGHRDSRRRTGGRGRRTTSR